MKRTRIAAALLAALLLQAGVLLGEYLVAVYPLWQGEEIRLQTRPVDPRSLFRGNYARLRYDISELPVAAFGPDRPRLRPGELVYVTLKPDLNGIARFAAVSLRKPDQGLFLRGRVSGERRPAGANVHVRFGIEAWFAPQERALQLERELRAGAVAVIRVGSGGRAALERLELASR
ncbi:MAG: GDYXXLXY domain-containing protein [Gammaproteobacteria bacterium]|nr:GDYXXLXY domain-containing protein [Gammaproteobacteria bacterium]